MRVSIITTIVLCLCLSIQAQDGAKAKKESNVKWYTFEEAIAANAKNPKKLFVDVYTTWCGPCKMMDKQTFEDPKVSAYLNENFYPVKLDAESKDTVNYKGHKFHWVPGGRRGVHTLAYSLVDGSLRYPTTVYLDEQQQRISIMPGFMKPEDFIYVLKYHAEEIYKTTTWDAYKKSVER